MIMYSCESLRSKRVFYQEYLFRITDSISPFSYGSWSKDNRPLTATDEIYVSPCIYAWVNHYFNKNDERIFAIERPVLSKDTMCCGINSHYNYCHNHCPSLLPKLREAILKHDYSDPDLKKMFKEHERRVMARFGKKLSQMKGGLYMGTLGEFDKNHPKDAYPEIIIKLDEIRSCKFEELDYIGKGVFVGKKSKKHFELEQELPKYGDRYYKTKQTRSAK